MAEIKYLVWSNEHQRWWRPNSMGYTPYLKEAGRYTEQEAIKCALSGALNGILAKADVIVADYDTFTEEFAAEGDD